MPVVSLAKRVHTRRELLQEISYRGPLTPAFHRGVKQLSQLNLALRADDGGDEGGFGGLPNWNTDSEHSKGMR